MVEIRNIPDADWGQAVIQMGQIGTKILALNETKADARGRQIPWRQHHQGCHQGIYIESEKSSP